MSPLLYGVNRAYWFVSGGDSSGDGGDEMKNSSNQVEQYYYAIYPSLNNTEINGIVANDIELMRLAGLELIILLRLEFLGSSSNSSRLNM